MPIPDICTISVLVKNSLLLNLLPVSNKEHSRKEDSFHSDSFNLLTPLLLTEVQIQLITVLKIRNLDRSCLVQACIEGTTVSEDWTNLIYFIAGCQKRGKGNVEENK